MLTNQLYFQNICVYIYLEVKFGIHIIFLVLTVLFLGGRTRVDGKKGKQHTRRFSLVTHFSIVNFFQWTDAIKV